MAAETQRTEGDVRSQLTVLLAQRTLTAMASSIPKILTGSVLKMGADAKKALALVWAFQRTDPLMAPARNAAMGQAHVSADAEAEVLK